ncbi:MAG: DUF3868 domain-containing protein [Tannerellaceae bacterium]|nr:DUF3868 domain-containing protein [Tannerellaceae bacterium]
MKHLCINILLLTIITLSGSAQHRTGGVQIHPITLQEQGDSLLLEMDIYVDGKSMNNCQSWTIMPTLMTADSSYYMEMPRALINGKTKAKLFRRKEKFQNHFLLAHYPAYKIDKKRKEDITFKYTLTAPYEFWMDTASLRINQILTSCADVEQWFILDNVAPVELHTYIPYQPDVKVNYITPEKETKTLHLEGSAYLDFQVGKSEILPNFRRNPQELAKINEVLSQVRGDSDFEITKLYVTGYASPEGSWASNDRLSYNRSLALKQYIQSKFSIASQLIEVKNVPEDWEGLIRMINESEMNGKYRVLEIIETVPDPDTRESRLRGLDGGRPFRYMLNEMFPSLRRVEYRVEFTVKEYSLEESELIMQKNPEQLNLYELTLLYNNYPEDSAERILIFNAIIRLFPDHPVANNNAAARLLAEGDAPAAARFIEKIEQNEDFPEAYNNLGVYYMLTEDIDKAEIYFNKARIATSFPRSAYTEEEVIHNIEELNKKREDLRIRERYKR